MRFAFQFLVGTLLAIALIITGFYLVRDAMAQSSNTTAEKTETATTTSTYFIDELTMVDGMYECIKNGDPSQLKSRVAYVVEENGERADVVYLDHGATTTLQFIQNNTSLTHKLMLQVLENSGKVGDIDIPENVDEFRSCVNL